MESIDSIERVLDQTTRPQVLSGDNRITEGEDRWV
jgi:hypothetical protein